jgi:hypothetical protein
MRPVGRLLVVLACAAALTAAPLRSVSFAQDDDTDEGQGCPNEQMRDPNTGNCVQGTVRPPDYVPRAGETCGQWCLCEQGMRPGENSCAPCQTSSALICYPF